MRYRGDWDDVGDCDQDDRGRHCQRIGALRAIYLTGDGSGVVPAHVIPHGEEQRGNPDEARRSGRLAVLLGGADILAGLRVGRLLAVLDFHLGRPVEIALIGDPGGADTAELLREVRNRYLPNRLLAQAPTGDGVGIPLLERRGRLESRATAYLCEGFVCQAPTTDPAELGRQLDRLSAR